MGPKKYRLQAGASQDSLQELFSLKDPNTWIDFQFMYLIARVYFLVTKNCLGQKHFTMCEQPQATKNNWVEYLLKRRKSVKLLENQRIQQYQKEEHEDAESELLKKYAAAAFGDWKENGDNKFHGVSL